MATFAAQTVTNSVGDTIPTFGSAVVANGAATKVVITFSENIAANANIDANQKLFYLHTIIPILNQFCSAFAHFFNNGVEIRPDRLSVPALQPDNRTQAVYYSTLVNTGIITPNEAREGLRFPKIENNDNIRIPQNITGSATDATQGGRPAESESTEPIIEETTNEG